MNNLIQCHYCGEMRDKNYNISFMAKCCIKRCSKYYCIDCIQKHFQPEYDSQLYRKDTWICYFCQEVCSCERCKKSEQITIERKSSKKRVNKTPPTIKNTGGEESIDNSQSNFSLSINNSKIPEQPVNIVVPSPNIQIESNDETPLQQKEQQKIDQLPKFKIIDEEDLILMPKFMRKIIERKNLFYNFILNDEKKKLKNNKIITKEKIKKYGGTRAKKNDSNDQQSA